MHVIQRTPLGRPLEAFAEPCAFQAHPLHHQKETFPPHLITAAAGVKTRYFKRPLFQTFLIKDKTAFFPVQELDYCPGFVNEQEYLTRYGVTLEIVPDNHGKGIDP